MPELGDPFFGHAVTAAEVAPIGNGYTEIVHPPVMGIDETVHSKTEKKGNRRLRKKEISIFLIVAWMLLSWTKIFISYYTWSDHF
jgi:hypothetical protein